MTRSIEDMEVLMKVMTEDNSYDRYCPPLPWRKANAPKKVGILKPLKKIPLSISATRALEMTKNALQKNSIEVVEVDISDYFEELLMACVAGFLKNEILEDIFKGHLPIHEELFNAFDGFTKAFRVPRFVLRQLYKKK